jgi:hypothetical protein
LVGKLGTRSLGKLVRIVFLICDGLQCPLAWSNLRRCSIVRCLSWWELALSTPRKWPLAILLPRPRSKSSSGKMA